MATSVGLAMRLPHYRLRTLLIAVAVVAIMLGTIVLGIRSNRYWHLAERHASLEREARIRLPEYAAREVSELEVQQRQARETNARLIAEMRTAAAFPDPTGQNAAQGAAAIASVQRHGASREAWLNRHKQAIESGIVSDPAEARRFAIRATYHSVLMKKYERLARYPWLPVAPDPPPPAD